MCRTILCMFSPGSPFRIVVIGNYAPEQCGLATFTTDLAESFAASIPDAEVKVVAMRETAEDKTGDDHLLYEVERSHLEDYAQAARAIDAFGAHMVCVQHEYGIFGGSDGSHLLTILRNVRAPIVTTLHTILQSPSDGQRRVLDEVMSLSERVVVMSERGREILTEAHGIHPAKVDMIPHGIPAHPPETDTEIREELGLRGRRVLLTFGLLSPDKGIQNVIEALPEIVAAHPTTLYVVLGATHPNIRRNQGEVYRDSLKARAEELGVADHIRWVNAFVSISELTRWICACNVYVTPYLKREQIVSGTLAYAVGLGRAVVSTPLWYAEEVLADGRGVLVPPKDTHAMALAINEVLGDDDLRHSLQAHARAYGEAMQWPAVALSYAECFARSMRQSRNRIANIVAQNPADTLPLALPPLRWDHLLTLTDDTGLLQHAKYGVPNRAEGYCIDDNARMLILAVREGDARLTDIAMSFVQYAFDDARGTFRNFMGYDRRWLEDVGSDDSNGRTIWALGVAIANPSPDPSRHDTADLARDMFEGALANIPSFTHLRSNAFAALGLCELKASGFDEVLRETMRPIRESFATNASPDWHWFEDFLSYDNARLSEAAIRAGRRLGDDELVAMGLTSLRWLMDLQTDRNGQFAPIGCDGFHCKGGERAFYDQQPLEATASIAALIAAGEADGQKHWLDEAQNVFAWFLGRNSIGTLVADPATGACHDGITPQGLNRNMGAESTLAYLMALADLRRALPGNPELPLRTPAVGDASEESVPTRAVVAMPDPLAGAPSLADIARPGTPRT